MKVSDCNHFPKTPAKPKGATCEECEGGSHALGLRVCLTCGHVGCCESDPNQHALKHREQTGHQVIASYPIDKNSPAPYPNGSGFIWCYEHNDYLKKK